MARIENLLTAKQVEAALRKGIPVQLNDGGGLYLSITEKNKGTWFMRGRLNGVAKRRVLGDEKVSLAEARLLRECPAYILLYQFSPKDTGQSKVK